MFNDFFFQKIVPYNVEKLCRTRYATDDNLMQCMLFACWITKGRIQTSTHYS